MKIATFGVEQWMAAHEMNCEWNLAETCVASLTVDELLAMTGHGDEALDELRELRLTYGEIEGTDALRESVAALYDNQSAQNVISTHGAVGANQLVYLTLVEPGDRVVSIVPSYQQHTSIPESLGAEVRVLRLREEGDWRPDLDELQALVGDSAKLITFTNPNNPTGSLMDRAELERIAEIAESCGAYVLGDEVYRGTDQSGEGTTASIADLYERAISVGSMSKAFSLAGLRLGWIAGPTDILHAVSVHRGYNTISVGMLDDHFARLALEHADEVLARSRRIVRGNLEILDAWVEGEERISYVKPLSGTTALLRYDADMSSRDFCLRLLEHTGVMLTPGEALDVEGYLRIGYANHPEVLRGGLERFSDFLADTAAA